MPGHRFLMPGPEDAPRWVRLYVRRFGDIWAAMIVGDEEPRPAPETVNGFVFFAETAEAAERLALAHLGEDGAQY